jgi:hypothetical protein
VLLPDAELSQQALGFLEGAGVEPGLDLGVQRMVERARLSPRIARAPCPRLGRVPELLGLLRVYALPGPRCVALICTGRSEGQKV